VRVLVTGGLGFLGRAVVAELAAHGAEVTALTHSRPDMTVPGATNIRYADLRSQTDLAAVVEDVRPDAVCHLAALATVRESFTKPIEYYDVNVIGTINLLRALEGLQPTSPVKLVFASTNAVYGSGRPGSLSEDDAPNPENPYAASKLAAEQLIRGYARTGRIGAAILRCFNIAGATADGYGDPDTTRIISAALQAASGEIPHVSVNGDGSAVREFTHVLDVAEAFRLALDATVPGVGEVYNIGTGDGAAMIDVIHAAEKITGQTINVVHKPPAREAHTLIANAMRAREALGWKPDRSALDRIISDAWAASGY